MKFDIVIAGVTFGFGCLMGFIFTVSYIQGMWSEINPDCVSFDNGFYCPLVVNSL